MDFFRKLTQQLRQIWDGMARPQKALVAIAAMASILVLGAVGYWASQTDYQVLYAGLAPEDAGAITSKLQGKGVSYRLAAGGTSILVPTDQLAQLRVELAPEDLQGRGGPGFGLFDQPSLGSSPFAQHVTFLRALQGELAKTIMQIEPVVFARVHIVRPEPSPFVRDQKPTTASVMLKLRPGAVLSRNVSAAITALICRSVEGLARENVTLVDAHGRLLSGPQDAEAGGVGSDMEQRKELENYLAAQAERMLTQVLGPGRAVVRVTADLNLKRHREKKEIYNPEGKVALSEVVKSTKTSSTGSSRGGPAGTASNLNKPAGNGSATGSDSRDESTKTEYAVSKTTQETEHKLGAIERLTVAALIDLSRPADSTGGSGEQGTISIEKVQEIIKKAVGFKTERDEIEVTQVKMADLSVGTTALDDDWTRQQQWQQTLALVRNISLAVMALAAILLVGILLRRKGGGAKAAAPAASAATAPAEYAVHLERIAVAVQRDPRAFSNVLQNWLNEPEATTRKAA